jgi:hypothetical protein
LASYTDIIGSNAKITCPCASCKIICIRKFADTCQ